MKGLVKGVMFAVFGGVLFLLGYISNSRVQAQPPAGPPRIMERPMMMGGPPPMTFITASGKYVFLVVGNTLYQLDAETLEVKKSTSIPTPPPPPAPSEHKH